LLVDRQSPASIVDCLSCWRLRSIVIVGDLDPLRLMGLTCVEVVRWASNLSDVHSLRLFFAAFAPVAAAVDVLISPTSLVVVAVVDHTFFLRI
jgi:hypothetical protein